MICKTKGCERKIRSDNKTGFCIEHRDSSPRKREKNREWAEKNREKSREDSRKWRAKNPEKHRKNACEWSKENPEKNRARNQTRRAKKKAQFIEKIDHDLVWQRDEGICHICGLLAEKENWHLDHIIPLVKGGLHCYSNVSVSHPLCNIKKGSKLISELE